MALFPCDRHGGRYSGKQGTAYLAVGTNGEMDRVRLRMCPPCLREVEDEASALLQQVIAGGEPLGDLQPSFDCAKCGTPGETVPIFLTAYAPGEDQDQWYGRLCPGCAATWRSGLLGDQPPTPPQSTQKRA